MVGNSCSLVRANEALEGSAERREKEKMCFHIILYLMFECFFFLLE